MYCIIKQKSFGLYPFVVCSLPKVKVYESLHNTVALINTLCGPYVCVCGTCTVYDQSSNVYSHTDYVILCAALWAIVNVQSLPHLAQEINRKIRQNSESPDELHACKPFFAHMWMCVCLVMMIWLLPLRGLNDWMYEWIHLCRHDNMTTARDKRASPPCNQLQAQVAQPVSCFLRRIIDF